jgi:hypothetical protein
LLIPALYLIIVLTMVLFWPTGCTSLRFNKQSERRISLLPTRIRANTAFPALCKDGFHEDFTTGLHSHNLFWTAGLCFCARKIGAMKC